MNKFLLGAAATTAGALLLAPPAPASAIVKGSPDEGEHPYVLLDGFVMMRTWPARCATSRC